jgi:hypothetical protein
MSIRAPYDVLTGFQNIHKFVLGLAASLDDEQLRWKPEGYSTSIGFHLWHLARESDYLKAALNQYYAQLGPDFGEAKELWQAEGLGERWGFPADLGQTGVGTGISDEAAAGLPIPPKAELLDYLQRAYAAIEAYVELLDTRYARAEEAEDELQAKIDRVRANLLVFLLHDARHLGMMEALKGLQTGFGSATEKRP